MSDCVEVLFTSESNGQHFTCCAWDPKNGANLLTYKGGGAANYNGIAFIRDEFLITANSTKPLIHLWPINSQDQISGLRFVVPGKPNTIAVSPDGNYLVAGINETIYIWEIRTGRMINAVSKHYQNVVVLKFTDDGSHLISASNDGGVLVWNLSKLVGDQNSNLIPLYSFHDHSLPVTDIHVGIGGMKGLLFSTSIDCTCRIYDLSSGKHLLNIVFSEPLTCVTCNVIETVGFVGTLQGNIYEFDLVAAPRYREQHLTKEDYTNNLLCKLKEKAPVRCMALSLDGETLVSGGEDNNVYIWHISSKQLIRTIEHKGHITNVLMKLNNKNMLNQEKKYNLIAGSLKRMLDTKEASNDSEIVEIEVNGIVDEEDCVGKSINVSTKSSQEFDGSNSSEIDRLREEVKKLKKANNELFQYSLKNVIDK